MPRWDLMVINAAEQRNENVTDSVKKDDPWGLNGLDLNFMDVAEAEGRSESVTDSEDDRVSGSLRVFLLRYQTLP